MLHDVQFAPEPSVATAAPLPAARPRVVGKFLFTGSEKFYVRGVTYGPFRPEPDGSEYHDAARAGRDFAAMRRHGVNALRTYTIPPKWLLDCAWEHELRVLVGLPWEQHVAFLGDRKLQRFIDRRVREGVAACAGHPALLGYAIGNEVPSAVVRWHGHRRVERHIERLFHAAKQEDPGGLVTYVNYPSTEYLELPFVDFCCFNVYLESNDCYAAYLDRLQNIAGDKPLVIAETGLDSLRNGEEAQARAAEWQIRSSFAAGCAGVFVFAWTDEWHRNHEDIEDWDFGLTRRDRTPKPALAAAGRAFSEVPFPPRDWPSISVVICTHRGGRTLARCLEGVADLDYPDLDVLVINDGEDAQVSEIAARFPFRLLNIPHAGLSRARNLGLEAARGEIVAYLDDDAYPDPHWLQYLAHDFLHTDFAALGGPNVPPATRRLVPQCVANAPGGPVHVLFSDRDAEHVPGCNLAVRRQALESIGGFDARFRVAGDDVDVCWRFHQAGYRIGFSHGAAVWHDRRQTVRGYWRQQVGYGRAEAMLEQKWPSRYNVAGQPAWNGRIYSGGRVSPLIWGRPRVYQGTWGVAPFQSMYEPGSNQITALARMPEWYLATSLLALLWLLGPVWEPLRSLGPLVLAGVALPFAVAVDRAAAAVLNPTLPRATRLLMRTLIAWLHFIQPFARLSGRLVAGLTPWRKRHGATRFSLPGPRGVTIWSERWRSPTDWLESIEAQLQAEGGIVRRGGPFDRWDLDVRGGLLGSVRLRMLIEEHGAGKQLVRTRLWPRCPLPILALVAGAAALGVFAFRQHIVDAAAVFGIIALFSFLGVLRNTGHAASFLLGVLHQEKQTSETAVSIAPEAPSGESA